jgi:hypothetical protein
MPSNSLSNKRGIKKAASREREERRVRAPCTTPRVTPMSIPRAACGGSDANVAEYCFLMNFSCNAAAVTTTDLLQIMSMFKFAEVLNSDRTDGLQYWSDQCLNRAVHCLCRERTSATKKKKKKNIARTEGGCSSRF